MTSEETRPDSAAADTDLELLRRVASGEEGPFERLLERHQGRILALCDRLLGDPEEARDATQDVFLKVYRKAGGFRPRAKVGTWIYRIAVNHCLNQLRRRRLVRMVSLAAPAAPEEPAFDPPAGDPDPERRFAARRRWAATRRAIERLPAGQRAVLVLARFEGLSYQEIAEVLGITLGAVESRLFRAMRHLERAQEEPGVGVP